MQTTALPAVELSLSICTYDIDFAGIVSNIVYIRWLEDLRFALLEARLPIREQMAAGIVPVLARTDIQYRRPLRLNDAPVGRMQVEGITAARIMLAAEIALPDGPAAVANQVVAWMNLHTGRPCRVPAALR